VPNLFNAVKVTSSVTLSRRTGRQNRFVFCFSSG